MNTRITTNAKDHSLLTLSILLSLFCLRVMGQLLVALFHLQFLPPMEKWHSNLLPYPLLLVGQMLIIWLFGQICLDFSRKSGYFFEPKKALALPLLWFGACYFIVMMIRFAICLNLIFHGTWVSGLIPSFFHLVLASFLLVLGNHHRRLSNKNSIPKKTPGHKSDHSLPVLSS